MKRQRRSSIEEVVGVLVAGVDEAGRGPLAGDVIAAAVILDPEHPIEGLMDSKKLTPRRRELLYHMIYEKASAVEVGRASVGEIDQLNILHATLLAMQRAVMALSILPDLVRVDGNQAPALSLPVETVVKGDQLDPSISAASIIAKVTRDREMDALDQLHPSYGFSKHKGYPTKAHIVALRTLGPLQVHRRSFRPVKEALSERG